MTLSKPKAVLFDLDGTFLDSAPDFLWVVNHLREKYGFPQLAEETIRQQVSNGGSALTEICFEISRDSLHEDHGFAEKLAILLDCYQTHLGVTSGMFKGIPELIAYCEQSDIAWGIVTNKPRRFTDPLLENLKINCPLVICPDDVNTPKPDPEALLLAAKRLNLAPETCWYVGDHIRDIEASRAAKMPAIAVSYGYIEKDDDIQSWNADVIIDQADQIISLIQQAQ